MASKKFQIHQFNNEIYPLRLFVIVDPRAFMLNEYFQNEDGSALTDTSMSNYVDGFEMGNVVLKENGELGVLIMFKSKSVMNVSVVAHESFHAASDMADILGLSFHSGESNEAMAYLISWIVKCCEEVKNG